MGASLLAVAKSILLLLLFFYYFCYYYYYYYYYHYYSYYYYFYISLLIGQSHDFWRAHSLFVARVVSFAPERSEGANDATMHKLYTRQKSCDYRYYQHTRPNRTNIFHKERLFNTKSCCRLQIPFTARTLQFVPRKGVF